MEAFGINIVTHPVGFGMQLTALGMARSLEMHGVPCFLGGIGRTQDERLRIGGQDLHAIRQADELRHPVNLYVMPLMTFERLFNECPWLLVPGRLHVASIWWEASRLPPAWIENLSRFDAVIAASGFIANVAANDLVLTPVIEAPHPLSIPAGVAADRARFGLPAGATAFCASFDPDSDPARKNPVALVAAFRMAFPSLSEDVRLAVRVNNAASSMGGATLAAMRSAAEGDARVSLLLEPMEYEDVLSFYASADVYLSLHRGEGLGLGLMESMALGKPVVATAWSGNTSFMDHSCACLVRYRKTAVDGNWKFFTPAFIGPGAFWAEPMVDDAAAWMRKLHAEPAFRARIGAAASKRFAAYQAEAGGRGWIDEIEAIWRARDFLPRAPGKFSSSAGIPS